MRALICTVHGPELQEFEQPAVMSGHVVVKVKAAALNRADLMMLGGQAHGVAGGIGLPLGLEWAGEIVEVGEGVDLWQVGDRVMAAGPGAFAEYVVINANWIYPIPKSLNYEQAAALPVALQTTHDAILTNGQLLVGQTVLIQGAGSAVAMVAIQVAKALGASQVIGTTINMQHEDALRELGADLIVDTREPDWSTKVLKITKRKGVDLVIDFLAGPYINSNLAITKIGGRIVNVGRMAGESGLFDFDLHSMRRISYVGVSFRSRSPAEITTIITQAKRDLMAGLEGGAIRLPIDSVFPIEQFAHAFERMSQNKHFGKIILTLK